MNTKLPPESEYRFDRIATEDQEFAYRYEISRELEKQMGYRPKCPPFLDVDRSLPPLFSPLGLDYFWRKSDPLKELQDTLRFFADAKLGPEAYQRAMHEWVDVNCNVGPREWVDVNYSAGLRSPLKRGRPKTWFPNLCDLAIFRLSHYCKRDECEGELSWVKGRTAEDKKGRTTAFKQAHYAAAQRRVRADIAQEYYRRFGRPGTRLRRSCRDHDSERLKQLEAWLKVKDTR